MNNPCTQECSQGRHCTCQEFTPEDTPPHRNDFARGLLSGLILGAFIAAAITLAVLRTPNVQ